MLRNLCIICVSIILTAMIVIICEVLIPTAIDILYVWFQRVGAFFRRNKND